MTVTTTHGIHPRDETMVIPIPSFADDHDTWPHRIDANASTLVSTPFLFFTFSSFIILSLPQLCPMMIMMTRTPSRPSVCTLATRPFASPSAQVHSLACPRACMPDDPNPHARPCTYLHSSYPHSQPLPMTTATPSSASSGAVLEMPETWPPCAKLSCGSSRSETLRK